MRSRLSVSFMGSVVGPWSLVFGPFAIDFGVIHRSFLPTANDERPTTTDQLTRFSHCSSFRFSSQIKITLEDAFHVHARRVNQVGPLILPPRPGVQPPRSLPSAAAAIMGLKFRAVFSIDQVAPFVALPGLYKSEVCLESAFHYVLTPRRTRVFPFFSATTVPTPVGVKKAGIPAPPARMRSENVPCGTRSKFQLSPWKDHLFEQPVLADISPDMFDGSDRQRAAGRCPNRPRQRCC